MLDIICIGAINYDYMFHCTAEDLIMKEAQEGDEQLSNPISQLLTLKLMLGQLKVSTK